MTHVRNNVHTQLHDVAEFSSYQWQSEVLESEDVEVPGSLEQETQHIKCCYGCQNYVGRTPHVWSEEDVDDDAVGDGGDDGEEGEHDAIERTGEVERSKLETWINTAAATINHTTWCTAIIHLESVFNIQTGLREDDIHKDILEFQLQVDGIYAASSNVLYYL